VDPRPESTRVRRGAVCNAPRISSEYYRECHERA
jgi:hypothetical protein